MDPKTIVFILIALAPIAYYTDPFAWDPDGRFGSNSSYGLLAAMTFLFAGVGVAYHFDLIPMHQIQVEIERSSRIASEIWHDGAPISAAAAKAQSTEVFKLAVSGIESAVQSVTQAVGGLQTPAAVSSPPPAS